MLNQMKSNPALFKQQYEAVHGTKLDDAQFNMMMQSMTPEMVR